MKRALPIVFLVALVVAVAFAAPRWFGRDDKGISASGTLEARNINIGSKVGGRVTQVLAQEGDHVQPGQLLVTFDDAELSAAVLQARGRLEQAKANLAKMERGSRPEDIAEARAAVAGAEGTGGYQSEQVAQMRADLQRARSDAENAKSQFERAQGLADEGVVSKQFRDDAETRWKTAAAQVRSMEHATGAAEGRLRAARAVYDRTKNGFRKEDIAAARAEVTSAEGALKQAEARYAERQVVAPSSAVIEVLDVRPGDLIPANAPLAKLLEAGQLYVMVYVPQNEIGHVRLGQKAEVRVDAFGKQAFSGVVEQIRQQAEFLPRNVQTKEEREHQVVGVKVRVMNPENRLRAGITADVKFLAEGN